MIEAMIVFAVAAVFVTAFLFGVQYERQNKK